MLDIGALTMSHPHPMIMRAQLCGLRGVWKYIKATQMSVSKGYLYRTCCGWGVSHHRLSFCKDSEAGRLEGQLGELQVGPKWRWALSRGCWHEEARLDVGQLEAGHSMWLVKTIYLTFSMWS